MNDETNSTNTEQIQFGKPKKSRKGLKIFAVILLLIVAVAGTAYGVYAWQQQEVDKLNSRVESLENQNKKLAETESKTEDDEGYLLLQDWGIKLKLPEQRSDIVFSREKAYHARDNSTIEHYDFTTKRVEALGVRCVASDDDTAISLARLTRVKSVPDNRVGGEVANDGKPVNGYYYLVTGANSTCANETSESSSKIQVEDRKLITDFLAQSISEIK